MPPRKRAHSSSDDDDDNNDPSSESESEFEVDDDDDDHHHSSPSTTTTNTKRANNNNKSTSTTTFTLTSKSPAEFFAENQTIAGFDNPGKALFTTMRELIENALDAAESINELPVISIYIKELSNESYAHLRGLSSSATIKVDQGLYVLPKTKKGGVKKKILTDETTTVNGINDDDPTTNNAVDLTQIKRFQIRVSDNGCGLEYDQVPNAFGTVLTSSKYGIKQQRGKFGMGAKMALIWSKKSTSLPVIVETSKDGIHLTKCKLDIDVHRNRPNVLEHIQMKIATTSSSSSKSSSPSVQVETHHQTGRGTTVELIIEGAWSTYKSRVLDYLQQMAVVTPYASFDFEYVCEPIPKKSFKVVYERTSTRMPDPTVEIKYHPSSVDDLIVTQLLLRTKRKNLVQFLQHEFSATTAALATRLGVEISNRTDGKLHGTTLIRDLIQDTEGFGKSVHQLTQLMRETTIWATPDHTCLSPAGEYNMRLGVMRQFGSSSQESSSIDSLVVATATSKPESYGGHPFIVEAAVAVDTTGKSGLKPGLNIYRFANRIPLLFEKGSDVVTMTANKQIKWGMYKINPKTDSIGVFVSFVSTKVPFKGTGKDYIGDDIVEIKTAVLETLRCCMLQLKTKLTERLQARDERKRIKGVNKYVPDIARSLCGILNESKQDFTSGILQNVNEATLTEKLFRAVDVRFVDARSGDGDDGGKSSINKRQRVDLFLKTPLECDLVSSSKSTTLTLEKKFFIYHLWDNMMKIDCGEQELL